MSAIRAQPVLLSRLPGWGMAWILVGLAACAIAATWVSPPLALILTIVLLAAAVAAAWRWPGQMLGVAAFATLADPFIVRAITPASLSGALRYNSEIALGLIGLPIAVRAWREGRLLPALRHPATPLLLGFVGISIVSALVNAVPPVIALMGIGVTLDGLALFYLARMVAYDERLIRGLVGVYVGIAVISALFAIGQALLAPDLLGFKAFAGDFGEGGRSTAFFGNPNLLGPLLSMALPIPLLAIPETGSRRARLSLLVVSLLLGVAFWLTFSRATWVGLIVAFIVVTAVFERRALLLGVAVGAIALGAALVMPRNLAVRDQPAYASPTSPDVVDATFGRLGTIGAGTDLRIIYLREGLPIAADHPLVGVGPGRYGGAAANVFGTPVYAEYGISLHGFHTVHNYWLHLLVEVGILGAAAMFAAVATVVARLLAAAKRAQGTTRGLLLGIAIALIALTLNTFAEMLLEGNVPSYVLWFLVGMASILADRALVRTAAQSRSAISFGG